MLTASRPGSRAQATQYIEPFELGRRRAGTLSGSRARRRKSGVRGLPAGRYRRKIRCDRPIRTIRYGLPTRAGRRVREERRSGALRSSDVAKELDLGSGQTGAASQMRDPPADRIVVEPVEGAIGAGLDRRVVADFIVQVQRGCRCSVIRCVQALIGCGRISDEVHRPGLRVRIGRVSDDEHVVTQQLIGAVAGRCGGRRLRDRVIAVRVRRDQRGTLIAAARIGDFRVREIDAVDCELSGRTLGRIRRRVRRGRSGPTTTASRRGRGRTAAATTATTSG